MNCYHALQFTKLTWKKASLRWKHKYKTNIQPRCHRGNPHIQVTYSSRNSTRNMQNVVTLWVAVLVSRQFLHVKYISLLRKRLITMYVVVLVEENENRLPLMENMAAKFITRVRDRSHCVTKITHCWNAVQSFFFFFMIIEIEHLLSWNAILLSSVIVAKERVPNPLIRREAGIPR